MDKVAKRIKRWSELALNKPLASQLTNDEIAQGLLKLGLMRIDEKGAVRSTIIGAKQLKRWRKRIERIKKDAKKGSNARPDLGRHGPETQGTDGKDSKNR
jgi:hypothetical protein